MSPRAISVSRVASGGRSPESQGFVGTLTLRGQGRARRFGRKLICLRVRSEGPPAWNPGPNASRNDPLASVEILRSGALVRFIP